ncbi:MAG: cobalt transporter CbiM [Pseudomonadota bacterium]
MHIVDGALTSPVLFGGAALSVAGIGLGLRRIELEQIPLAGVLSAAFFIASLIQVPLGPSSVHLILNGLAGVILGWAAFPALFVGLLLQAVFFGFGGFTVLGVNTLNIAGPAVLTGLLVRPFLDGRSVRAVSVIGGAAGGLSVAATTAAVALCLMLSGDAFVPAAQLVFVAHIPVMAVEAVLTAAALGLIARVKPELLQQPRTPRAAAI